MQVQVGMTVQYFEPALTDDTEPMAAVVIQVKTDEVVNLTIFLPHGKTAARTNIHKVDSAKWWNFIP